MTEPHLHEALALLQRDPKEAKKRYQHDPEVTEMISRYMRILGSHFELLGKDNKGHSAQQKVDTKQGQSIVPEDVESLLSDPQVEQVLDYVKKGGQLDPRKLPPMIFSKIKILLERGVLQLHS